MNKDPLAQPEAKKTFDDYNRLENARLFKLGCWFAIVAMRLGSRRTGLGVMRLHFIFLNTDCLPLFYVQ